MPIADNSYSSDPIQRLIVAKTKNLKSLSQQQNEHSDETNSSSSSTSDDEAQSVQHMSDSEDIINLPPELLSDFGGGTDASETQVGSGLLSIAKTSGKKNVRYYHAFPAETQI